VVPPTKRKRGGRLQSKRGGAINAAERERKKRGDVKAWPETQGHFCEEGKKREVIFEVDKETKVNLDDEGREKIRMAYDVAQGKRDFHFAKKEEERHAFDSKRRKRLGTIRSF